MQRESFRHLDRDWEAAIPDGDGEAVPVRFRRADDHEAVTYETSLPREELEDGSDGTLALRRGLECALVLDVLSGHEAGLTADEVAELTGMPPGDALDRLEILDEVQPVLDARGPRRYRSVA